MYIPKIFQEHDVSRIYDFIREFSFATIVSSGTVRPIATHTPLMLQFREEKPVLTGHIIQASDQKDRLTNGCEALCIFQGPHAYISPRWYAELKAPTWNFRAVHVYGKVTLLGEDDLTGVLSAIVDRYESGREQPIRIEDIPAKALEEELKGACVFEVSVDHIEAAEKLSQNADEPSYKNIIHHLKQDGDFNAMLLAFEMERRHKKK